MSHHFRLFLALAFSLSLFSALPAQPKKEPKEKSPAEKASDAFYRVRDAQDVTPGPERFPLILDAGFAFLLQYASHKSANGVINSLATYGATMRGNKYSALRLSWLSTLQYEILNRGSGEFADKATPAALNALAAAANAQLVKEVPSRENLAEWREKIDRLALRPESAQFLMEQEQNFIGSMKNRVSLAVVEKHVKALMTSPDQRVAEMAKRELNLVQLAMKPLELSFRALNGDEVNVETLRGRPLFFLFWATTNESSLKEIQALKEDFAELPAAKFSVILVCCDKEEDRVAVETFLKKSKLKAPVWFPGTGLKNEFAAKLNVSKLPVNALFNDQGIFVSVSNKLQVAPLKKMLESK